MTLIMDDKGYDFTFDTIEHLQYRVEGTLQEVCPPSAEAWTDRPDLRRIILEHLVYDHGLEGPDLQKFLLDADCAHIYRQLHKKEDDVDVMYRRGI